MPNASALPAGRPPEIEKLPPVTRFGDLSAQGGKHADWQKAFDALRSDYASALKDIDATVSQGRKLRQRELEAIRNSSAEEPLHIPSSWPARPPGCWPLAAAPASTRPGQRRVRFAGAGDGGDSALPGKPPASVGASPLPPSSRPSAPPGVFSPPHQLVACPDVVLTPAPTGPRQPSARPARPPGIHLGSYRFRRRPKRRAARYIWSELECYGGAMAWLLHLMKSRRRLNFSAVATVWTLAFIVDTAMRRGNGAEQLKSEFMERNLRYIAYLVSPSHLWKPASCRQDVMELISAGDSEVVGNRGQNSRQGGQREAPEAWPRGDGA